MLLRRTACQRLEPVCIVRGSAIHCPFAHTGSYGVGDVAMNSAAVVDVVKELLEHIVRDIFFHPLTGEDVRSEIVLYFAIRFVRHNRCVHCRLV